MVENSQEIIAVFIDGENINPHDFIYINKEIRTYGRVVISNVYGDWSDMNVKNWIEVARTNGILKIQCDKINGKNSVDLRMSVDIMKYLYTNNIINIFYLVTTDSDYRHVIFEIKQRNKKVYCIGSSNVNLGLTAICDKYTKIENIKKGSDKNANNKQKITKKHNFKINDNGEKNDEIKDYWFCIEEYLTNNGKTNLSNVKTIIQNNFPEFDYREYGYSKFSDFMKKNYKQINIQQHNIDLIE
tara:strand:- start:706 stop:1434 length:729 start_codon:yes stop_codon:yes gene_type:complete